MQVAEGEDEIQDAWMFAEETREGTKHRMVRCLQQGHVYGPKMQAKKQSPEGVGVFVVVEKKLVDQ